MPEILTESFCERCGTRYTFESAAPRGARLKGIKVMSRGLRNFVMSDDTSMDEAMAAARNETDREVTSQQLDAFHKTFNFCMSCRQYTCGNCWNEAEGRCLSCAPHLGHEIMPAPFPTLGAGGAVTLTDSESIGLHDRNGHDAPAPFEPLAWPTSDLMRDEERPEAEAARPVDAEPIDAVARLEAVAGPIADVAAPVPETPPAVEEAAPIAEEPAPIAESPQAIPELLEEPPTAPTWAPGAGTVDDQAAAAAANTSDLFRRFRPGQSLDDEIEAFERAQAEAVQAPLGDAAVSEPAPAPIATPPEPEPAAAAVEPEPEPEPVAAAVEPEPEPEPVAAETRDDLVAQPTWRITAPEAPTTDGIPSPTVAPPPSSLPADSIAASAEPRWPTQPEWPSQGAASGLPFLGRPAAATGGIESLWAESAREVATIAAEPGAKAAGGVQPCVSCGLSLSANARFCRRCGTRQG